MTAARFATGRVACSKKGERRERDDVSDAGRHVR